MSSEAGLILAGVYIGAVIILVTVVVAVAVVTKQCSTDVGEPATQPTTPGPGETGCAGARAVGEQKSLALEEFGLSVPPGPPRIKLWSNIGLQRIAASFGAAGLPAPPTTPRAPPGDAANLVTPCRDLGDTAVTTNASKGDLPANHTGHYHEHKDREPTANQQFDTTLDGRPGAEIPEPRPGGPNAAHSNPANIGSLEEAPDGPGVDVAAELSPGEDVVIAAGPAVPAAVVDSATCSDASNGNIHSMLHSTRTRPGRWRPGLDEPADTQKNNYSQRSVESPSSDGLALGPQGEERTKSATPTMTNRVSSAQKQKPKKTKNVKAPKMVSRPAGADLNRSIANKSRRTSRAGPVTGVRAPAARRSMWSEAKAELESKSPNTPLPKMGMLEREAAKKERQRRLYQNLKAAEERSKKEQPRWQPRRSKVNPS